MRKIIKTFAVLLRNIIKVVDCFAPRLYMRLYNWYLKKIGVDLIGIPCYIHPSVIFDGKGLSMIHLGDNVVISRCVLLLVHDYSITCGLRSIGDKIEREAFWLKDVVIGNNVFVGANVTILPGTKIGDDCIIGAGSVIKGSIEKNSIIVGNPAVVIAHTTEWAIQKKRNNDFLWE